MEHDYEQATAPRVDCSTQGETQVENVTGVGSGQDRQDVEYQFELAAMREADRVEKLRQHELDKASKNSPKQPVPLEERYKDNDRKSQTKMDAFTKK